MDGKGRDKNFVVTFHLGSTGYTDCCGVYSNFERALGHVYTLIHRRSVEDRDYLKNFQIDLPRDAEGQNAWIIKYKYEDDTGVQDDEYYLIYDNRRSEADLKELAEHYSYLKRLKAAKDGTYIKAQEES